MILHSTNNPKMRTSLTEGVVSGLAPDRGLYVPDQLPQLPQAFFKNIGEMQLTDIAYVVANRLFADHLSSASIKRIVDSALNFPIPLRQVEGHRYVLELFHGPTMSFKDVGARFMAKMMEEITGPRRRFNVIVATSGDSGGAVANGFSSLSGAHVYVLFAKDKLSRLQEAQFTSLGSNVTAIEVNGTFDDCQALVKEALLDSQLNADVRFTSANSINLARLLPQVFYYFQAYARAVEAGAPADQVVIAVPSGNLGNLSAGVFAKRMGLPVKRLVAANNRNDVFTSYVATGTFSPRRSVRTFANAMDVGNPSNFARLLDLYGNDHAAIVRDIRAYAFADEDIRSAIAETYSNYGYLLDPHGATAFMALGQDLAEDEVGIALETAAPVKFAERLDGLVPEVPPLPDPMRRLLGRTSRRIKIPPTFSALKHCLLTN